MAAIHITELLLEHDENTKLNVYFDGLEYKSGDRKLLMKSAPYWKWQDAEVLDHLDVLGRINSETGHRVPYSIQYKAYRGPNLGRYDLHPRRTD
jgi:hypothetical protein